MDSPTSRPATVALAVSNSSKRCWRVSICCIRDARVSMLPDIRDVSPFDVGRPGIGVGFPEIQANIIESFGFPAEIETNANRMPALRNISWCGAACGPFPRKIDDHHRRPAGDRAADLLCATSSECGEPQGGASRAPNGSSARPRFLNKRRVGW